MKPFAFAGTNAALHALEHHPQPGTRAERARELRVAALAHEGGEGRLPRVLEPAPDHGLEPMAAVRGGAVVIRAARGRDHLCRGRLASRRDHIARVGLPSRRPPCERPLARLRELLPLGGLALLAAVGEAGQHLLAEELERLADVLVLVRSRLLDEDHLIDARVDVALDQVDDLVGRADRTAQRAEPLLEDLHPERAVVGVDDLAREAVVGAPGLELLPDVRDPRPVVAEHVVVSQRVAEEMGAVDTAFDRRLLVLVQHHRKHHRKARIDGEAGRHALVGPDQGVVLVHPLARLLRLDEGERERADAPPGGHQDRLPPAARDPERRVRLLLGLRHDAARRHRVQRPS